MRVCRRKPSAQFSIDDEGDHTLVQQPLVWNVNELTVGINGYAQTALCNGLLLRLVIGHGYWCLLSLSDKKRFSCTVCRSCEELATKDGYQIRYLILSRFLQVGIGTRRFRSKDVSTNTDDDVVVDPADFGCQAFTFVTSNTTVLVLPLGTAV